ncbi:cytochrome c oxidase subunit II [Qipengyuania flava]|uniref:cytochrome c oxidase subunit II n=1 Tax=Qipengyuania sp. NPDC077563 TaxID=3364497 RepID=UPI001CD63FDA|nr:cytochrome c oxidase subunit II [Qipengyuania flava]
MKTLGFHRIVASLAMAVSLLLGAQVALAQTTLEQGDLVGPVPDETPSAALEAVDPAEAADVADPDAVAAGSGAYTPMKPTAGKGMPVDAGIDIQPQYSQTGEFAYALHSGLIWVMVLICAFVLALMLYVVIRFRRKANPVPSKTSHNTLVEVVWTVVPALILLGIAIPSITLIAKQYETPPKDAITIKAIGYQWYWGYAYPDNGDFEIVSNMLDADEADARGEPHQLAVDNRMVVPVGVPIRLQVTGADVIHSFAVPSLWFKMDAVPGRLNEKIFQVDEPGVYYGQCSELCGARHGYMPIAVEALPMDQYNAWVLAQGGTIAGAEEEGVEANPSAAPLQEPESSEPGAPGAGAAPVAPTEA